MSPSRSNVPNTMATTFGPAEKEADNILQKADKIVWVGEKEDRAGDHGGLEYLYQEQLCLGTSAIRIRLPTDLGGKIPSPL